jgi:hypothetical protein
MLASTASMTRHAEAALRPARFDQAGPSQLGCSKDQCCKERRRTSPDASFDRSSQDARCAGLDVLVAVEHVVGVVLRLDLGEPSVGVVALGLANSAGVIVGVEEVDVDAGAVGLESLEESPGPPGLRRADRVVLVREPYCIDAHVVD